MDFSNLKTTQYWFDSTPSYQTSLYLPLIIVFAVMILLAIWIYFFVKGDLRKVWFRFVKPFTFTGVLGLVYLLARYEQLPYLAARVVLGLIIFIYLIWTSVLLFWSAKFVPEMKKEKIEQEKFNKYLPKDSLKPKAKS